MATNSAWRQLAPSKKRQSFVTALLMKAVPAAPIERSTDPSVQMVRESEVIRSSITGCISRWRAAGDSVI